VFEVDLDDSEVTLTLYGHPLMGERDLAWTGTHAAPDKGGQGSGMTRLAEKLLAR
jgi:hypothetical protein